MRNQALRADVLMLITAVIWGSAFVAQTSGMNHIGPFLYSGLRFALGSLCLYRWCYVGLQPIAQPNPFLPRAY